MDDYTALELGEMPSAAANAGVPDRMFKAWVMEE